RRGGVTRAWSKVLPPVMRPPAAAAAIAGGILLAMTIPVLHLHTAQSGLDALPANAPTVGTLDRVQNAFVGTAQPAEIAVKTPSVDSAGFKNAVLGIRSDVAKSPLLHGPVTVDTDPQNGVARIVLSLQGNGVDATSYRALAELRDDVLPSTVGQLPNTEWAVTGNTAASHDYNAKMKASAPYVF